MSMSGEKKGKGGLIALLLLLVVLIAGGVGGYFYYQNLVTETNTLYTAANESLTDNSMKFYKLIMTEEERQKLEDLTTLAEEAKAKLDTQTLSIIPGEVTNLQSTAITRTTMTLIEQIIIALPNGVTEEQKKYLTDKKDEIIQDVITEAKDSLLNLDILGFRAKITDAINEFLKLGPK